MKKEFGGRTYLVEEAINPSGRRGYKKVLNYTYHYNGERSSKWLRTSPTSEQLLTGRENTTQKS